MSKPTLASLKQLFVKKLDELLPDLPPLHKGPQQNTDDKTNRFNTKIVLTTRLQYSE